jgi:hypothetical protein
MRIQGRAYGLSLALRWRRAPGLADGDGDGQAACLAVAFDAATHADGKDRRSAVCKPVA